MSFTMNISSSSHGRQFQIALSNKDRFKTPLSTCPLKPSTPPGMQCETNWDNKKSYPNPSFAILSLVVQ